MPDIQQNLERHTHDGVNSSKLKNMPTSDEKDALDGTGTPSSSNKYATEDETILKSLVDAKGDVISATADNTPARLAVGANDKVLMAASGESTGLKWGDVILESLVDAKGDLISATADNTPARLAVGTFGQFLSADSAESTGLKWLGTEVIVSDVLRDSADTSRSTTNTSYELGKEIKHNDSDGEIRVKFSLRNSNDTGSVFGRVYVNGSPVGAEHEHLTSTETEFTDDISVSKDDLVQLYVKYANDGTPGVTKQYLKFRIHYDRVLTTIDGTINTD